MDFELAIEIGLSPIDPVADEMRACKKGADYETFKAAETPDEANE